MVLYRIGIPRLTPFSSKKPVTFSRRSSAARPGINLKASHSGQESKIFRTLENGWGHLTIIIIIIDKTKLIIVTTMTQR